jgi:hypothetical protein
LVLIEPSLESAPELAEVGLSWASITRNTSSSRQRQIGLAADGRAAS